MKKILLIGFALLLAFVFTVPVMAEFKIGGIIFTDFYYLNRDEKNAEDWGVGNGTSSYGITALQLPNISRLHARWTNEDNVGMYIELGIGQGYGNAQYGWSDGVELRHAYGWWDITPDFQLLAGKTTTPFSVLSPSQLLGTRSGSYNVIGCGYGDIYPSRVPQIRGTYKFNDQIRVALSLVDPNSVADVIGERGPWSWASETSTKIPRIDLGVPMNFSWFNLYPSFMWQRRTVDIIQYDDYEEYDDYPTDDAMTTYAVSLGFKTGFQQFTFSAEGNYGKNLGNTAGFMGFSYPAIFSSAGYENGQIHDAESYSFWGDLSYKIGVFTPHLIYGEMRTKNRFGETSFDSKAKMYGISCPIDMAKGFIIRPEIMFYDDGVVEIRNSELSEDYDAGTYAIYGVQFQITF